MTVQNDSYPLLETQKLEYQKLIFWTKSFLAQFHMFGEKGSNYLKKVDKKYLNKA